MARPSMERRFEELSRRVLAYKRRLGIPAVALGLRFEGEERLAAWGRTSLDHPLPAGPDTVFQIGSITKTMTATALAVLVDRGLLDLDRPLREVLPGFAMADPEVTRGATTRHLLTHTGGWVGDYFDDFGHGDDALARMVERVGALPQVTPLGALWSYNNAGFYLAGRVLEVLAGEPYEAAVNELLLEPLGLRSTLFFPDDELLTRSVAVGHQRRGRKVAVARPWAIGRAGNCVGGAVASVRDLLAYARLHLREGLADSGARILSRAACLEMRRPQAEAGGRGHAGLAWSIRTLGDIDIIGHGGATKGQEAVLHLAPGRDFALALLTNSGSGGVLTSEILGWALELFFGLDPEIARPIAAPVAAGEAELGEYRGRYDLPLSAFDLRPRKGGFTLHEIPRGGFPKPGTPPAPAAAPMRAALCGKDRLVVLDEPMKGAVADFIRGPEGAIRYCRIDGRVHPKMPAPE